MRRDSKRKNRRKKQRSAAFAALLAVVVIVGVVAAVRSHHTHQPSTSNQTAVKTGSSNTSSVSNTTSGQASNQPGNSSSDNSSNTTGSNVVITTVSSLNTKQRDEMQSTIQVLLTNPKNEPIDCSAFVQDVYKKAGIKLPRTVAEQNKVGVQVDKSQLQYGDMVFFNLSTKPDSVTFDGIYVGNNHFVARTTHGIMSISFDNTYWKSKFLYGRRVH